MLPDKPVQGTADSQDTAKRNSVEAVDCLASADTEIEECSEQGTVENKPHTPMRIKPIKMVNYTETWSHRNLISAFFIILYTSLLLVDKVRQITPLAITICVLDILSVAVFFSYYVPSYRYERSVRKEINKRRRKNDK